MNEGPLKKVSISQFQIRNASDVASSPVTPVKIAPPPSTVKRSKSLKTDRTKFKKTAVCSPGSGGFSLPRRSTGPIVRPTEFEEEPQLALNVTSQTTVISQTPVKQERNSQEEEEEREIKQINTNNTAVVESDSDKVADNGNDNLSPKFRKTNSSPDMPQPPSWQAIVNTHRRGSSMTFVSTQEWAQFETNTGNSSEEFDWSISADSWNEYEETFHSIKPLHGFISGKQSREYLMVSGLSRESLAQIWNLADMDHDGSLSLAEFAVAMHCIAAVHASLKLPDTVPVALRDSLLHHVSLRNNLLSSLKKIDKNPEKSSLKSSCSKGVNVSFSEDCVRSRPRPHKKLITTRALHLQPQSLQSSSSYYSSENSEDETFSVSRRVAVCGAGGVAGEKCHGSRESVPNNNIFQDDLLARHSFQDETGEPRLERDDTLLEEEESLLGMRGDEMAQDVLEEVSSILPHSTDSSTSSPEYSTSSSEPFQSPASSTASPHSTPEQDSSSSHQAEYVDAEGYERLLETENIELATPNILLDEGEVIESDDSSYDIQIDELTPRGDVTQHDDITQDDDTQCEDTSSQHEAAKDTPHSDITASDITASENLAPDIGAISNDNATWDDYATLYGDSNYNGDAAVIGDATVIDEAAQATSHNYIATSDDATFDDDVKQPIDVKASENFLQTDFTDTENVSSIDDTDPENCSPTDVTDPENCSPIEVPDPEKVSSIDDTDPKNVSPIDVTDLENDSPIDGVEFYSLVVEDDAVILDDTKESLKLDNVESTVPDFEKINKTGIEDLQHMVQEYELHNFALLHLSKELKLELLKVQEEKLCLMRTLKLMKNPDEVSD